MIRLIKQDELHLIKDDPVRPHLSAEWRTRYNKEVYVLESDKLHPYKDHGIDAVICVAYMDEVPTCENDLKWPGINHAIFYTVWSYRKGAGREIINGIPKIIKRNNPYVKRFVTMSPKTEMARNFHIRNGAVLLAENPDTYNFEYIVND